MTGRDQRCTVGRGRASPDIESDRTRIVSSYQKSRHNDWGTAVATQIEPDWLVLDSSPGHCGKASIKSVARR